MAAPIKLADIAIQIPRDDADFHRATVADLLHRQVNSFPGAQPVSFARHHIHELQQVDYFMCEKTDGIRCLMYLTELHIEGEIIEAQFLIDRKNDYYYVPRDTLHLPTPRDLASHHTGTLLDGELVRQTLPNGTTRLAYLTFDLLAIDGESVMTKTFDKRLARINEFIKKPLRDFAHRFPQDVAAQPFQIEMKHMEFPYGMEMMFKDKIPKLPHGNDGLIFTCRETGYTSGTDPKILKWKPPHENTVDFRLVMGPFPMLEDEQGMYEDWDAIPILELHVNHGKAGYQYYASLTLEESEWEALKRLNRPIDGLIIECYRDPRASAAANAQSNGGGSANGNAPLANDVWRPKLDAGVPRFREDKEDANYISVVQSVEESIRDAVTEAELIAAAGSIRNAYKARQKAREEEARAASAAAASAAAGRRRVGEEEEDDGPRYED